MKKITTRSIRNKLSKDTDFRDSNLNSMFAKLNKKWFKGELPTIPVKWSKDKKLHGAYYSEVSRYKGRKDLWKVKPLYITFSTVYNQTLEEFETAFIHEMIHLWVDTSTGQPIHKVIMDNDKHDSHGKFFEKKRKELSKKLGREIPIEDGGGKELGGVVSPTRLCILWRVDNRTDLVSVYSLKVLKSEGVKGVENFCNVLQEGAKPHAIYEWKILTSDFNRLIEKKIQTKLSDPLEGLSGFGEWVPKEWVSKILQKETTKLLKES